MLINFENIEEKCNVATASEQYISLVKKVQKELNNSSLQTFLEEISCA